MRWKWFPLSIVLVLIAAIPASAVFLKFNVNNSVSNSTPPGYLKGAIPPPLPGEQVVADGLTQSQLVVLGRHLFNNETFNGNGRTCATCHPALNNFTIDPQYIAKLPPSDPLFVFETQPALANLENGVLLRGQALICANVDGFDQPCRYRGVPHTLALRTSTTPPLENPPSPGNVLVPGVSPSVALANSTGWSGDGAPIGNGAAGELRLFAAGAVTQHFTKTLNRVPGVDFRVPSNLELDAIQAFLLANGRQADIVLKDPGNPVIPAAHGLVFKNPVAEFGALAFQNQDIATGARCSLCHNDAGANRPPNNVNAGRNTLADTRVVLTQYPPEFILQPDSIFLDGGFGKPPALSPNIPNRIVPNPSQLIGYGNGQFKAPPLIEAAATPPFFHDNLMPTIEAAIAFYGSPEFNQPNVVINLDADKVAGLSAFLRAFGAYELISRAIQNNNDAITAFSFYNNQADAITSVTIAQKNISDALKLLQQGVVSTYPQVQTGLAQVLSNYDPIQILSGSASKLRNINQQLLTLQTDIADFE